MWGRADLEKFYSSAGKVLAILVVAMLIAIGFMLKAWADDAQHPPTKPDMAIQPLPVICMTSHTFSQVLTKGNFYNKWQGLTGKEVLTTLWDAASSKAWLMTMQKAGSDLICIISAGDNSGEVGEEVSL